MRVWVDITDASHVVFFAPIVRRLEDAGHTVTVTARRFAGADLVLRRYGLGGVLTTGHRGGGLGTRAVGLVNRTAQRWRGSRSAGLPDSAPSTSSKIRTSPTRRRSRFAKSSHRVAFIAPRGRQHWLSLQV